MRLRRRAFVAGLAVSTVAALAAGVAVPPAGAGTGPGAGHGSRPATAIVSLGDSYISGEAGRWRGNALDPTGSRNGTDRAWTGAGYDTSEVYLGGSDANGCHRSDVAEVRVAARLTGAGPVNLACSGAGTVHVRSAASGGQPLKGEPPQADRLAAVARHRDVDLVVVSVGGNDLGFGSMILSCVTAYTLRLPPCRSRQQAVVDARLPEVTAAVGRVLDDVRAAMAAAGRRGGYRLVVQSYPSPVPRAAENRYPETGPGRSVAGCPFYDTDLDWARDSLVPHLSGALRAAARSRRAEFLDVQDLLQGREVCSGATSLVGPEGPSPRRSEWVRFVVTGPGQGEPQEWLHPSAYAQRALGRCLALLADARRGEHACRNTPGAGPAGVVLLSARR